MLYYYNVRHAPLERRAPIKWRLCYVKRISTPPVVPALLERLERWLRKNRPRYYASLRRGVQDRELIAFEYELGRTLPAGFRELYRWRDGQDPRCTLAFQYNQMFMPLKDVRMVASALAQLCDNGEFPEANWWSKSWLPFLGSREGDHLCVDMEGMFAGVPGQVLEFFNGRVNRNIEYPSLEKWLKAFIPGIESGLWMEDGDEFKPCNVEQVRAVQARVAPGYPREFAAGSGPAVTGW